MLNKNDPLIGAVQEVMKRNQLERDAAKLVNEKFGVSDRKALPHEKQGAWDAAYKQIISEGLHPNQQKLDVHEPEKDKLTKHDFKMLRAKKKPMEEDVTSPSAMGIQKPDYAAGTPDYAKSKEQTVNRAAKTSLPAGTMKEDTLEEKAVSKAQHRFFGLVRGIQKGKAHGSAKAEKAAKEMSAKSVKDYAKAKEKGLPEKVSEALDTADRGQIKSQTQYGGSGTSAMTGMPTRSAPADRVGTSAMTGMPTRSASTRQTSTGAQIGGARPSPSVGGNAGSLAKSAQGQRTSNAIRNLNTPGLRTTNKVNAAGQKSGPNVGLPQKATVVSTGEKANVAGQKAGPNAAMGQKAAAPSSAAPKPTVKPTAAPTVKPSGSAKPATRPVAKPTTGAARPSAAKPAAKLTPVRKPMSRTQRDSAVVGPKGRMG